MARKLAVTLALATAAVQLSTSNVREAFAGKQDMAIVHPHRTATGSSTPGAMTAGQTFRDCSGCPQMVVIPAGRFLMGSEPFEREEPVHPVRFDTAFAVARFETTFDEWDACVSDGGCVHNKAPFDEGWGKGRRPAINVSWNDAKEYAAWLSRKTGRPYRLLTEAEYEYAERAGSTTTYFWGNRIDCGKASYDGGRGSHCAAHVGGSSLRGTQLVGSYPANRWGLRDMLGNVWEWCEDNWHPNYRGAPDNGSPWRGGDASMRILRGGAWNYSRSGLRSADRNWAPYGWRASFVGFRVATDPNVIADGAYDRVASAPLDRETRRGAAISR